MLYSSLVFSATVDGRLNFTNFEPFNKELPPVGGRRPHRSGGVELSSPDAKEHPFQYKGMAVNNAYLFGLYSGQRLTRMDLVRSLAGSNIRFGEGRYIVVINRESGEYLNHYKLDRWAAAIAADENYIYAIDN